MPRRTDTVMLNLEYFDAETKRIADHMDASDVGPKWIREAIRNMGRMAVATKKTLRAERRSGDVPGGDGDG